MNVGLRSLLPFHETTQFMEIVVLQVNETLRFSRMKSERKVSLFYCSFTISSPIHHHMVHPQYFCSGAMQPEESAKVFFSIQRLRKKEFRWRLVIYRHTIHQNLSINYANCGCVSRVDLFHRANKSARNRGNARRRSK